MSNAINVTMNDKNYVMIEEDEYKKMMEELVIASAEKKHELYKQGKLKTFSKEEFVARMDNKKYV